MSKWPMRGHFKHLHFKTFPMTPRTLQSEVFWPLLLNPKHSGVSEDSKSPTLGVFSHLAQSGVATINAFNYTLRDITLDWCHNTCQKNLTVLFWSLHRHFANVIKRLKMMSKDTWSWRTWSKRLKGWTFIMKGFISWLMVYKYQPHTIFWLLCLRRACNYTLKLRL